MVNQSVFFLKSFLFILSANFIFSKLDKSKVLVAINCGGSEFTDSNGIVYVKDKFFDAGVRSDHGLAYDISGTEDQDVYQTERWHSDTFSYSIPIKEQGKYVIILKFSEVYFTSPNEKVFDVALGKKIILKNLDIFSVVGKAAAYDEYIEIELKDDKVFHNKVEAAGAYDPSTKQLKLKFIKGPKDNPKINAIVILKGDINDTEFGERKKKLDEENRKKLQQLKKSMLLLMKHHPDVEYDEDLLLNDENDNILTKEDPSIIEMFFSLHGVYIIASFLLFLGLNYSLDFLDGKSKIRKVRSS